MQLVVDVSNNNGKLNLAQLHLDGIVAKASEGHSFTDSTFEFYRAQAHKLKLPFGAYHFYRPGNPVGQAERFAALVGQVEGIRPTVDVETDHPVEHELRQFSQKVHELLGSFPLFYSYGSFIEGLKLSGPVGGGLWIANYGVDNGQPHPVGPEPPWKHIAMHQFTSKYGGRSLDMSIVLQPTAVFRGTPPA